MQAFLKKTVNDLQVKVAINRSISRATDTTNFHVSTEDTAEVVSHAMEHPVETVAALRGRLATTNPAIKYLTLSLLEDCVNDCNSTFHHALCQDRELLSNLLSLAISRDVSPGGHKVHKAARKMILDLSRMFEGVNGCELLSALTHSYERATGRRLLRAVLMEGQRVRFRPQRPDDIRWISPIKRRGRAPDSEVLTPSPPPDGSVPGSSANAVPLSRVRMATKGHAEGDARSSAPPRAQASHADPSLSNGAARPHPHSAASVVVSSLDALLSKGHGQAHQSEQSQHEHQQQARHHPHNMTDEEALEIARQRSLEHEHHHTAELTAAPRSHADDHEVGPYVHATSRSPPPEGSLGLPHYHPIPPGSNAPSHNNNSSSSSANHTSSGSAAPVVAATVISAPLMDDIVVSGSVVQPPTMTADAPSINSGTVVQAVVVSGAVVSPPPGAVIHVDTSSTESTPAESLPVAAVAVPVVGAVTSLDTADDTSVSTSVEMAMELEAMGVDVNRPVMPCGSPDVNVSPPINAGSTTIPFVDTPVTVTSFSQPQTPETGCTTTSNTPHVPGDVSNTSTLSPPRFVDSPPSHSAVQAAIQPVRADALGAEFADSPDNKIVDGTGSEQQQVEPEREATVPPQIHPDNGEDDRSSVSSDAAPSPSKDTEPAVSECPDLTSPADDASAEPSSPVDRAASATPGSPSESASAADRDVSNTGVDAQASVEDIDDQDILSTPVDLARPDSMEEIFGVVPDPGSPGPAVGSLSAACDRDAETDGDVSGEDVVNTGDAAQAQEGTTPEPAETEGAAKAVVTVAAADDEEVSSAAAADDNEAPAADVAATAESTTPEPESCDAEHTQVAEDAEEAVGTHASEDESVSVADKADECNDLDVENTIAAPAEEMVEDRDTAPGEVNEAVAVDEVAGESAATAEQAGGDVSDGDGESPAHDDINEATKRPAPKGKKGGRGKRKGGRR